MKKIERGWVDPKLDTCWVDFDKVGFGMSQYTCFSRGQASPIGLVWGLFYRGDWEDESRFDITHIYVRPPWRRWGVATFMLNEALKHARVLLSWGTTSDGLAFAEKFGFKHDARRVQWYYVRPKGKK